MPSLIRLCVLTLSATAVVASPRAISSSRALPSLAASRPVATGIAFAAELAGADEAAATAKVPTAAPPSAVEVRGGAEVSSLAQSFKVLGYFALWYALNVVYNIKNKQVLNKLSLPWLISVAQLLVGSLWIGAQWLVRLRPTPEISGDSLKAIAPIGVFHGTGQALTVMSLSAGAVSFTHIVKALEPFFSAIVSAVVFKKSESFIVTQRITLPATPGEFPCQHRTTRPHHSQR